MGKHSRNRRGRRQPTNVIQGPDFRMERRGRFVLTEIRRSPEEQANLVSHLAAQVETIEEEIRAKKFAVLNHLQEFDSFDILAALSVRNHMHDPETYKETTFEGRSFVPEYAALLALGKGYQTGSKPYPMVGDIETIQNSIIELYDLATTLLMARDARRTGLKGKDGHLRYAAHTHELGVRVPAYTHHHHEVLHGLFDQFDEELIPLLGYGISDVLSLFEWIPTMVSEGLTMRVKESYQAIHGAYTESRKVRRGQSHLIVDESQNEVVRDLAKLSDAKAEHYATFANIQWLLAGADLVSTFSIKQLADASGLTREKIAAILRDFALHFGEVADEFVEPQATHALKRRPLIEHQGIVFCPAPGLLDWSIQAALEENIKAKSETLWQRYQKNRHDYLVSTTAALLRRVMPEALVETNLTYTVEAQESTVTELDALCLFDRQVFLIEAKAADLTDPAKRGAPERLERDLGTIVGAPHAQANRARELILASEEAVFTPQLSAKQVRLRRREVSHLYMVSVSLAPIGHLTALMQNPPDGGVGSSFFLPGQYSWMVSLYDLMVIADLIEIPAMFPHYVSRRERAAKLGVLIAHDELDVFGFYLKEGLYLEDFGSDPQRTKLQLASYTTSMDDYYAYTTGIRETPARKPKQQMDPPYRRLIEAVAESRLPGRVAMVMQLLDLSTASRRKLIEMFQRARNIQKRERRLVDMTIYGESEEGWAITIMVDADEQRLAQTLDQYGELKQNQLQAKTWYGIGMIAGKIDKVVYLRARSLETNIS